MDGYRRTQGRRVSRYHESYAARPSYDYAEDYFDSGYKSKGGAQGYYSSYEPEFSNTYGSGRRGGMSGAGRMPRDSRNPYGMHGAHYSNGETRSSAAPDREPAATPYTVEDPDGNIIDASPGYNEGSTAADDKTSAGYGARGSRHRSSRRRPDPSDFEDTLPRQHVPGAYGDTRRNDSYGSGGTRGYGGFTSDGYPSSRGYSSHRHTSRAYGYGYPPSGHGASGYGSYCSSAYSGADDGSEYMEDIGYDRFGGCRDYDRYGRPRKH